MSAILELQRQINALQKQVERLSTVESSSRRWEGTIANDGTANPFGSLASPGGFAGVFTVVELNAGAIAEFITGGTAIVKIADGSGLYTTTAGTASKANVYLDANYNVVIQNKLGSSDTFYVLGLVLRPNN